MEIRKKMSGKSGKAEFRRVLVALDVLPRDQKRTYCPSISVMVQWNGYGSGFRQLSGEARSRAADFALLHPPSVARFCDFVNFNRY